MHRTLRCCLAVLLLTEVWALETCLATFRCVTASAQTPAERSEDANEAIAAEVQAHVSKFEFHGADEAEIKMVEQPLLTYTDPARVNYTGSLWAFGSGGRPVAFLDLAQGGRGWAQAISLASERLIEADIPSAGRWRPQSTDFKWQTLADQRPPSDRAGFRLTQMKAIARAFEAHEFWDPNNSRFELRLLSQPVYRYEDPAAGVLDAAVFCFTHGTNPEIILLLEAVKTGDSATWQYGLVRMGSAELHAAYQGKEVWQLPRAPGVTGSSLGPYWLTGARLRMSVQPPAE